MPFRIFNTKITSIHAAALIIGAAGFLSRLLGLFRDRLLASHFGAGDTLDAYYAAFQIPDFLFTVFLIGAASAAILPIVIEYRDHGKNTELLVQTLLTVFGVFATIAVLLLIALVPFLMPFVVPGFPPAKLHLTVTLTRMMMLSPLFLGIAAIISSVLQAYHRFLVYALPPIFYNAAIIFAIIVLTPALGARGLAIGVAAGALLQVLIQLPVFFALGFRPRFIFNMRDEGVRRILRISLPRVAALSFSQITMLILIAITSFFTAGAVSVFKFATNLIYFPVGLFGVSYALAIFPKLSERMIKNEGREFLEELTSGIRNIIFWSLPVAFLFIVLRAHIVRVVLGAGLFNWGNTRLVAAALAALSIMVIFEGLNTLLIRAFYALEKTWEPLFADMLASFLTIVAALAMISTFHFFPTTLQYAARLFRISDLADSRILAVVLAFAFGSLLNFFLLFWVLNKVMFRVFEIPVSYAFFPIAKFIIGSLCAAAVAYITLLPFPQLVATNTFIGIATQGIIAGLSGLFAYFVVLTVLRSEEFLAFIEVFRGRFINLRVHPKTLEIEKLDGQESGK